MKVIQVAIFKNRKKYAVSTQEEDVKIKLTKMAKREMILTVVSIFAVLVVSMGSAYAVCTSFTTSKDYNRVTVGTLDILYSAEAGEAYGDTINLTDAFPTTEDKAGKPYKFTLTNNGTLPASYTVSIKDDTDMIEQDGCSGNLLDKTKIKISINGNDAVLLSDLVDATGKNYIIDSGSLGVKGTQNAEAKSYEKSYEIKMWITEEAGNEVLGKHFHGKIVIDGSEYRESAVQIFLNEHLDNGIATYSSESNKDKLYAYSHEAGVEQEGWSKEELTDYRYIGENPNNYVTYNNEIWRIIGVFTVDNGAGRKEQRMKLVRKEGIPVVWDSNSSNNWTKSSIMKALNEEFSLTSEAESMIGNAKWYLGGYSTHSQIASKFYEEERDRIAYQGYETSWKGKVGLIYPSDYGYATGTNACLEKELNMWETECQGTSWLNQGSNQWTMMSDKAKTDEVITITNKGYASNAVVNSSDIVAHPVVYLRSEVQISGGKGTEQEPYTLTK